MEDKVVASWMAFFLSLRVEWEDPMERSEELWECADETNVILARLAPKRAKLPNTKVVIRQWSGWSNERKRAWGCRLLEECLRVRVSDICYGYMEPHDKDQYRHIVFGNSL